MNYASTKDLLSQAYEYARTPFVELFDFSDSACVVTGGAKGIGYGIAKRFAELGAGVVLADIDPETGRIAAALSEPTGDRTRVTGVVCDVTDAAALAAVARDACADRARLIWVNSAGIYPTNLIEDMNDDAWNSVIDLDLNATFWGCRAATEAIRERSISGVIINLSSVAGFRVGNPPGISHYAAAKHGVQGLTKALAFELGRDGIRVVGIAPGTVITDGLIEKFGPVDPDAANDRYSQSAQRMPIPRPSLPDDVARAAVFLASPAAAMLTGTILPVDAGHLVL